MTDFLDEKKREIQARLSELKPLVQEAERLQAAADALDGVTTTTTRTRSAAPARRARAASNGRASGNGRRGRPKGSGTRSKQALQQVKDNPGITIPELAQNMGIKQNYLYRVMPDLPTAGLVKKEGRGWHPLQAA